MWWPRRRGHRQRGPPVQARVLEVGEERDAAAQQAADAEAAVQAARRELEAAVAQREAQLRQVMEAQQRLAQQLDASESAEQARRTAEPSVGSQCHECLTHDFRVLCDATLMLPLQPGSTPGAAHHLTLRRIMMPCPCLIPSVTGRAGGSEGSESRASRAAVGSGRGSPGGRPHGVCSRAGGGHSRGRQPAHRAADGPRHGVQPDQRRQAGAPSPSSPAASVCPSL